MNRFWAGFAKDHRQEVEKTLAYREAANAEDGEKAQRIACELLEGHGRNKREAKEDRQEKKAGQIFREFDE